jgi:lipopolysaccharide transport system ATP-binding protein
MVQPAIQVNNVGKEYRLGQARAAHTTLRDALMNQVASSWRRRVGRPMLSSPSETIWALKDISFEVEEGEAVGIIGRNGAGKSTLLKVLSRITEPTVGSVDLYGRVGSLLEVGTGFHPELTGRENIYLNGAIIGMRRTEIDQKFDEIVAFSEVERFIDTAVKHYSSGMYLRLAFAVAAHLEPEILLIDEVLAVGDAAFQRKCLGKMGSVAQQGRTVLFVSHNMGAITQLCGRAYWISDGRLKQSGPAAEVVAAYLSEGTTDQCAWTSTSIAAPDQEARLETARVLDEAGEPTGVVDFDRPFQVDITYRVLAPIRDLSVAYQLFDAQENLVFEAMDTDLAELKGQVREPGSYRVICGIPAPLLKPGRYHLSLVSFVERVKIIERQPSVLTFDVTEVGYSLNPGRLGVVAPVLHWTVQHLEQPATSHQPVGNVAL